METLAASIGFIMITAFIGKVISIVQIAFKGDISPANYKHRILSNDRKIKIQLCMPYFLFFYKWEDYKTAESLRMAMNSFYRTKLFNSIEEAEDHIELCKEHQINKRKNNNFTVIG